MPNFFTELQRRHVVRIAGLYLVVGWVIMQVVEVMSPALGLPDWTNSMVAMLLIIGFPVTVLFAWAFQVTPEGLKRTVAASTQASTDERRWIDYVIVAGFVLVAVMIIADRFAANPPQMQQANSEPNVGNIASDGIQIARNAAADVEKPEQVSIAVLPFVNMSSNPEQEYFSDGVTEEILHALVRVPNLRVAGRRSSFSFKGQNKGPQEIATALGVTHLLDGSVRRQNGSVRIATQLVRAADGVQIWAETYDGSIKDIFDLQDTIANTVTTKLEVIFNRDAMPRLAVQMTDNAQAYEHFLQGRALFLQRWGYGAIAKATEHLEDAVALDPEFAEAWSLLGFVYYLSPLYVPNTDPDLALIKADEAVLKARALKPSLAEALSTLSAIEFSRNNNLESRKLIEQAIALEPFNALVANDHGLRAALMGQTATAMQSLELAVKLDPVHSYAVANLAYVKLDAGLLDEAEALAQRAIDLGDVSAYETLSRIAFAQGDREAASRHLFQIYELAGDQLAPQFADRRIWEAGARAFYEDSEPDRLALIGLAEAYLASPDAVVNSAIFNILARTGSAELLFETYQEGLIGKDMALRDLWGPSGPGRKVRQHPDFPAFAERIGMADVWRLYGWPDQCKPTTGTDGTGGQFECL